jgi:hypothetical protein
VFVDARATLAFRPATLVGLGQRADTDGDGRDIMFYANGRRAGPARTKSLSIGVERRVHDVSAPRLHQRARRLETLHRETIFNGALRELESTEILGRGLMPPSLFLRLETGQADHG